MLLPLIPLLLLSIPSLTTAISTITLPAPTPTTTSPSFATLSAFQSSVLNSTNTYRHQHNASALTWNTTLATYAASHASKCHFAHSGGAAGENLAAGYGNVTATVEAWGNERREYDFGDGGFGEDTGHFTQLVWKATRSVGCGREACNGRGKVGGWFVVCEYWPPGNVKGGYKSQVQKEVGSGAGGRMVGGGGLWGVVGVVVLVVKAVEVLG